jgi:4-methylaminobutanoate oxidase (formaldehyde-forming)
MAEWIAGGEPPMDLWGMDIRRFGAHFGSPSYTVARANEVYETYYSIAYPGTERQAGRPLRVSPVYEWHRAHGAAFGEKAGWERVNYYEANAPAGDPASRPKGWAGRLWSPATGAEHLAARERAALFDESSFAKSDVRDWPVVGLLCRLSGTIFVERGRRTLMIRQYARHRLISAAQFQCARKTWRRSI